MEKRDNVELLTALFNNWVGEGNDPKLTYFMQHMTVMAREHIKPLCSRAGSRGTSSGNRSVESNDWKAIQKSRYSGHGMKWIKLSVESILPTLNEFDASGIDTADYRSWIESAGFAWVRYRSPKLIRGVKMACFEVPLNDSRVNHPHFLHFIADTELDELERMSNTPFALGLENRDRGQEISRPEKSGDEKSGEEISQEEIDVNDDDDVMESDAF